MFDHQLQQNAVPSRMPIRNSYVTSGFGTRADPFGRGAATHKGMDFHAKVGDPVMAVAEGVVSFAGVKGATATWSTSTTEMATSPATRTIPAWW